MSEVKSEVAREGEDITDRHDCTHLEQLVLLKHLT